jgi:deazaflavin-dependent oxidoreductase (nitroreductase family)
MAGPRPLTDDRDAARDRPLDEVGKQLSDWGVVAWLETTGRRTGATVTAAVGYVEEPDGSVLVAAGSAGAGWARNLDVDPRCRVTIGVRQQEMVAEPLAPADAARLVSALILRYGTPAERLGLGPSFRLRPRPAPETRARQPRPGAERQP